MFPASRARALAVIVVAVAVSVMAACGGDGESGAIIGPDANETWTAQAADADVGEVMSIGTYVALAPGVTETAVLRSIRLTGNRGLDVVGVTVNGPKRTWGLIGAEAGYPTPAMAEDVLALPGASLPTGDDETRRRGLAITFGVRRTSAGRGFSTGFATPWIPWNGAAFGWDLSSTTVPPFCIR